MSTVTGMRCEQEFVKPALTGAGHCVGENRVGRAARPAAAVSVFFLQVRPGLLLQNFFHGCVPVFPVDLQ